MTKKINQIIILKKSLIEGLIFMYNSCPAREEVILIGFTRFHVLSNTYISGAYINNKGSLLTYDIKIHNIFDASTMQDIIDGLSPPKQSDCITVHNVVDLPEEGEDVAKIQRFVLQEYINNTAINIRQYPLVLLPHIARFIKKHNIKFNNNAESLKQLYKTLKTAALGTGLLNEDFLFMMDSNFIESSTAYSAY